MAQGEPCEVLKVEFKETWGPNNHGKMMDCDRIDLKRADGSVLEGVEVNRLPSTAQLSPGVEQWFSLYENSPGFWKGKKEQGPRQSSTGQANFTSGDDVDKQAHPVLVRRDALQFAVRYAASVGESDLKKIEAWMEHFESLIHRASGQAQPPPPSTAPAQTSSNGDDPKISKAQVEKLIPFRQKTHQLSDQDMDVLLAEFGVVATTDLKVSQIEDFLKAMADPIKTGQSDIPAEHEPTPVTANDKDIPFAPSVI